MLFPDRTGTGDLRLDLDEFGDYKTVHFASESFKRPTSPGIFRDQRDVIKQSLKFPKDKRYGTILSQQDNFLTKGLKNTMHFPET